MAKWSAVPARPPLTSLSPHILLPARLRNHPFADRERAESLCLHVLANLSEENSHASALFNVDGTLSVHPGRPGTLVGPHSLPGDQEEGGITDEIEQIMKPSTWIVGCPTVQLGLDLPYPALSAKQREHRLVSIHRRPPGIPASLLPTCWPPSPCADLSSARTATKPPPHPTVISRRRTCPSVSRMEPREGDRGWFPRSPPTVRRGRCPAIPRQPRHEYAAGFPRRLLTGLFIPASESPASYPRRVRTANRSISTRFDPARRLRSFTHWFLSYTFSSRLPDPPCLAVPERPGVVRTAFHRSRHLPGPAVLSFTALL